MPPTLGRNQPVIVVIAEVERNQSNHIALLPLIIVQEVRVHPLLARLAPQRLPFGHRAI